MHKTISTIPEIISNIFSKSISINLNIKYLLQIDTPIKNQRIQRGCNKSSFIRIITLSFGPSLIKNFKLISYILIKGLKSDLWNNSVNNLIQTIIKAHINLAT